MKSFLCVFFSGVMLAAQLACGGGGSGTQPPGVQPAPVSSLIIAGQMLSPRHSHTATTLLDGRILMAGGNSTTSVSSFDDLGSAETFNPSTKQSMALPTMYLARSTHTSTRIPNGRVYMFGGTVDSRLTHVEYFDPALNDFVLAGHTFTVRWEHTATLLQDGKIFLAGGSGDQNYTCEVFDPSSNTTETVGWLHTQVRSSVTNRSLMTSHLLSDGSVILLGGFGSREDTPYLAPVGIVEVYDPLLKRITVATPLMTPRYSHASTLLPDGRILVIGGVGFDGISRSSLNTTELYDPRNGTVTPGPLLSVARHNFRATPLPDGRVYISGGESSQINLQTGTLRAKNVTVDEIFDPATNRFSLVQGSAPPRFFHATVLSNDGIFYSIGGLGEGGARTEILKFDIK